MKYNLLWVPLFAVLCCSLATAEDESSEMANNDVVKAVNAFNETPISKINVIKSDLCKKCSCISNPDYSQIDCSNKNMSKPFSEEEWKILKNGDITFDTIKMEHNLITNIIAFPAYPVKNVYLGFNQIASIEKGAFANLTELTKLNLAHNKLTTKALDPNVFKGLYSEHDFLPLGKVIELDLGHNDIHSLDADLFEHLPKLETLLLSSNTFQVIDQNTVTAISGLSFLKTLDMSFMELEELPDNLFHGPRDLETIILTGNLFDELPDDLDLATNLRELVLDENPIADLTGENIFPTLPNLRYLSMSYMPDLSIIGAGTFAELQNLETLILSSNPKLSKIDEKAFTKNTKNPEIYSFPPLEKLYLHNNNLTQLDHGLLERWDKITVLDLRYNPWICDCNNRWPIMNKKLLLVPLLAVLCFSLAKTVDAISEKTEYVVEKAVNTSAETTSPTTTISKINILASDLCRKCNCKSLPGQSRLDCSVKHRSKLFSDEEWKILKNGDATFDTIKLGHNNIKSIQRFPEYPVKTLCFRFNDIASIEKGAFANLTALTKLDLGYNKLTTKTLDPDIFRGLYFEQNFLPLDKMKELDLGHNDIHSLDADLFEYLPNLETLTLSGNKFQVIDQNTATAISGLPFLKSLVMSHMQLRSLPEYLFHGLRDLERLILSGNQFDKLPDGLSLATNLWMLVLDANPIVNLTGNNLLPKLPNLTYLSISYMPELRIIGAGAFAELQNLTTLIISRNPKLSKIDEKVFIKNTASPEVSSFPPLEKLYLQRNNLTQLGRGLFDRWNKLKVLDLRHNYWICDCRNRWLIEDLMVQLNYTNYHMSQDVKCAEPTVWKNVPLVELNTQETRLKCGRDGNDSESSIFLVGLLVVMFLCILIFISSIALWRRGCFGLNRVKANRSLLYNRASFSDGFSI